MPQPTERLEGLETAAPAPRAWIVWATALLGVVVIGGIDWFSGVELRVFPLYYLPVGVVAWYRSRWGTLTISVLCGVAWFLSNYLAGMQFSRTAVWVANTVVQGGSFAIVALLIASLRTALSRERSLSRTDPLTALMNARAFHEDGARLLGPCRRNRRPVTVAYIDLDHFKAVNDQFGHQAGDDLLRAAAGALRASVRNSDLVARLGGDEFVALLPEVSPPEAALILERLRLAMATSVAAAPGGVTVSVGGITFLTLPAELQDMVRRADACMYVAKASGKNRVHLEVVGEGEVGLISRQP